jgi:hypothetical protein
MILLRKGTYDIHPRPKRPSLSVFKRPIFDVVGDDGGDTRKSFWNEVGIGDPDAMELIDIVATTWRAD